MKKTLLALTALLAASATAHAEEPSTTIHYVGFNHFVDEASIDEEATFTDYIEAVLPIMERHGLTLSVYSVAHASGESFPADAITFGTAPNRESFAAFFADPDYQAVFPMLTRVIEDHTVVFTAGAIEPKEGNNTLDRLLTLYWFDGENHTARPTFDRVQASLSEPRAKHGVVIRRATKGVQANEGLAAEVKPVTPLTG